MKTRSALRGVAVAVGALGLLGSLGACDSDSDGLANPDESELYGLWVNVDAGTVRAFWFAATDDGTHADLAGRSNVYTVSVYPEGTPATEVQRGTYEVLEGHLVTSVVSATDTSQNGRDFANMILGFSGDVLTLESMSSASGRRVFNRATDLP